MARGHCARDPDHSTVNEPSAAPATIRAVFLPRWHDNPYQDLLGDHLARLGVRVEHLQRRALFLGEVLRRGRPDVVHLHAPDHFVVYARTHAAATIRFAMFVAQLALLKRLGIRLVWTAHDLMNHEGRYPDLDARCRRATAALADAIIVHCACARREVISRFGVTRSDKLFVIPHGGYSERFPATPSDRTRARHLHAWPLDETMMLFLGNLRRHKGLPELIDAFRAAKLPDTRLVIRGQPFSQDIADQIAALVTGDPSIDYKPGFVTDAQVPEYMQAADAVVCPFTSSLTSGSVSLAMTFGRACVAPRLGCIPEMLGEGGGVLYDPGDKLNLVAALRTVVAEKASLDAMGRRNLETIQRRRWPDIARATCAVYRPA